MVLIILSLAVSFLVAFAIGRKWKRWLLLIPLFLLGGAIGFGFGLSELATTPAPGGEGIGWAIAGSVGVIIGIVVITISSSIFALIGGAIGIAVGKKPSC